MNEAVENLFEGYDEDTPNTCSNESYAQLHKLVDAYTASKSEVETLESKLKQAKQNFRNIAEVVLPEFLASLNLSSMQTSDGLRVTLHEDIHANISEEREDEAFKWLDDNGQSALIQRQVVVSFDKDQEPLARRFLADLRRRKVQLRSNTVRKVHPSTLKAWIKRALSDGEDIPLATFGVFRRTVAKVDVNKK